MYYYQPVGHVNKVAHEFEVIGSGKKGKPQEEEVKSWEPDTIDPNIDVMEVTGKMCR